MTREQAALLLQYIHFAVEKGVHAAKHAGYVDWSDLDHVADELLSLCEEDTP